MRQSYCTGVEPLFPAKHLSFNWMMQRGWHFRTISLCLIYFLPTSAAGGASSSMLHVHKLGSCCIRQPRPYGGRSTLQANTPQPPELPSTDGLLLLQNSLGADAGEPLRPPPPPAPQDPMRASGAGETGSFPSRGLCSPRLSAPSSQHPEPRAPPHHQGWSSGSRLPLPAPG